MRWPVLLAVALFGGTSLAEVATTPPAPSGAPPAEATTSAKPPGKTRKTNKASKGKKKKKRTSRSGPSRYGKVTDATTTPAWQYGQMTQDECEAELTTRAIGFTREPTSRGVRAPVRLTEKLHGVEFRTDETEARRQTSPYEVGDCRLILAMDDFSKILEAHDIVQVRHYSMWRPPAKSWPEDKEASRHAGALALDAGRFTKSDGKTLDVDRDFHGRIGAKTCGEDAKPRPATPDALELRAILCDAAALHVFNVMLTPNFNRPHHNHFHLEVTAGVKWFLLH
ncbi:MAG: extensin family protein [Myxococcales bacterium]|nr:extensin family protein [Myxococcales bacterium]